MAKFHFWLSCKNAVMYKIELFHLKKSDIVIFDNYINSSLVSNQSKSTKCFSIYLLLCKWNQ